MACVGEALPFTLVARDERPVGRPEEPLLRRTYQGPTFPTESGASVARPKQGTIRRVISRVCAARPCFWPSPEAVAEALWPLLLREEGLVAFDPRAGVGFPLRSSCLLRPQGTARDRASIGSRSSEGDSRQDDVHGSVSPKLTSRALPKPQGFGLGARR